MKLPGTNFSFKYSNDNREIASIVLMRGIASLMVCFFHLSNGNTTYLPDTSVIKQIGKWGWAGVEVFFIISGFVIPYSMFIKQYTIKDIGVFFTKRLIRIEPPYLISILLVLVLGYISSSMPFYKGQPFVIDWINVLGHAVYLNIFTGANWLQDIYWTLAIEFQFYLLMSLTFGLLVSNKILVRLSFYAGLMGALWLNTGLPVFISNFANFFMLGIILFQFYVKIIPVIEFLILLFITAALSIYFASLSLTIISLATIALIVFVHKVHPFFIFLGSISYSLYLVHIPLGGRFMNTAIRILPDSVIAKEILVFAGIGFSILMAWLYYSVVEKRFKLLAANIKYVKKNKTLSAESGNKIVEYKEKSSA